MKRILIGTPIEDSKEYCIEKLFEAYQRLDLGDHEAAILLVVTRDPNKLLPEEFKGKVIEADAIGTGCCLIRREHERYYERHKTLLVNILGGRCQICGFEPTHPAQMDVHEIRKATTKTWPFALLRSKDGLKLLLQNIENLMLLCRNCHACLRMKFETPLTRPLEQAL